ncbi:MAG: hypothetical protein SOX13_07550 [Sodaliphilus sp.]|nr:hypothetical protein [Sodaliphilus sp.]
MKLSDIEELVSRLNKEKENRQKLIEEKKRDFDRSLAKLKEDFFRSIAELGEDPSDYTITLHSQDNKETTIQEGFDYEEEKVTPVVEEEQMSRVDEKEDKDGDFERLPSFKELIARKTNIHQPETLMRTEDEDLYSGYEAYESEEQYLKDNRRSHRLPSFKDLLSNKKVNHIRNIGNLKSPDANYHQTTRVNSVTGIGPTATATAAPIIYIPLYLEKQVA